MKRQYTDKQLAIFALLAAILIGGGLSPLNKFAIQEIPPLSLTFIRFVIAALTILPFFLRHKPNVTHDLKKAILFSFLLSFNAILFSIGITFTTANSAQLLYIFVPLLTALFSYFLATEYFNGKKIAGIILGFIGASIIILLPLLDMHSPFAGNLIGNLLIFIGAICTALYTVLSKKFQKHYTPLHLTTFYIFTAIVCTFPFAIFDLFVHPGWWHFVSGVSVSIVFYLGFLGTSVFYILYQYAIKHGSPLIASMLLYLQPPMTFIWSALLLGEKLTTGLVIGSVLAFIGVYLTIQSKKN